MKNITRPPTDTRDQETTGLQLKATGLATNVQSTRAIEALKGETVVPAFISMKSIEDLQQNPEDDNRPYRFFVPSYQRGYRWGKAEVSALMDDLSIFFDNQKVDYCLQPIVVKLQENGTYEVIDGQQRLTTLLILLQYADPSKSNDYYSITYATRPHSQELLQSLNVDYSETPEQEDNPDFHYMALALKTIQEWARAHGKDRQEMNCFLKIFRKHTKIIWYELPADNDNNKSIDLFRKINVGKIPLTNAELVKGLLLSNNGFSADTKRAIANEWDHMEHRLQDDALWCFLTNDIDEYLTRIDLVLDIWLKTEGNAPVIDHVRNPYAVFNYLYDADHKQEEQDLLRDMWQKCKSIFANLEYWFDNRELYHLIGYLIAKRGARGKTDLLNLYAELANRDKSDLHEHLRTLIRKDINPDQIANLTYSDGNKTRDVLLLFNLLTLNNSTSSLMRFPFANYKKEQWDLEHVHATAGGPPKDEEVNRDNPSASREMFFKGVLGLLTDVTEDKSNENRLNSSEIRAVEDFINRGNFDEQTCKKFWEQYQTGIENKIGDQDSIDNLALLPRKLNRGYRNASFIEKRRWIISADRDTIFIPPCTKNVFLKYYTDNPIDFTLWSHEDREAYLNGEKYGIITTLKSYLCDGKDEQ